MSLHRIIVLFLLMISIDGCTNSPGKNVEQSVMDLHTQLMALHDSTMNQYGICGSLAEQLKKLVNAAGDSVQTNRSDSIRTELDASNEYMMDWMNTYHEPEKKDSAAMKYFKAQIDLLSQLAAHQKQAIEQAHLILNSIK